MISDGAAFQREFDVPRETMHRLDRLAVLLTRWNPRINLVSKTSLEQMWDRHFADSAQLWTLRPPGALRWADFGAGAGFPGLVIAALAADAEPGLDVYLVESDQRKAVFLTTAAREAGLCATVLPERVEQVAPLHADVVSARALAPLGDLLAMSERHRKPGGIGLFPKGASVHKEIADAEVDWRFDRVLHPSRTDPKAAIVEIGATRRV